MKRISFEKRGGQRIEAIEAFRSLLRGTKRFLSHAKGRGGNYCLYYFLPRKSNDEVYIRLEKDLTSLSERTKLKTSFLLSYQRQKRDRQIIVEIGQIDRSYSLLRGFLIPFIFRVLFLVLSFESVCMDLCHLQLSLKLLWRWGSAEYWQIFLRPLK